MSIQQAISIGIAGNEASKTITGTSEVSAGRTVVPTAAGGAMGGLAAGLFTAGATAAGLAAAPVAIPFAAVCAGASFVASLFD